MIKPLFASLVLFTQGLMEQLQFHTIAYYANLTSAEIINKEIKRLTSEGKQVMADPEKFVQFKEDTKGRAIGLCIALQKLNDPRVPKKQIDLYLGKIMSGFDITADEIQSTKQKIVFS